MLRRIALYEGFVTVAHLRMEKSLNEADQSKGLCLEAQGLWVV
jgi:hypothetical protein